MSNMFNHFGGGFGSLSEQQAKELSKALEAGHAVGAGKTGGGALRVESLEASLKVLTYNSSHIQLWKKMPKSPAYSTVEEYNQLSDYGGQQGPFVREGELPQASDSSYARRTQLVKFLGTVREVTHQASLVHPAHGDLMALENQNGILWLLEQIEKSLFTGDSSLAFDGEGESWDGLDALVDAGSVIDLEGNSLQEGDIEEGTNTLIEAYARPTDLFLGTRASSDLVKVLYPRERVTLPAPVNGQIGMSVQSVMTQGGVVSLNPDVFIRDNPSPPAIGTSVNAPDTPATLSGTVIDDTTGDFNKGAVTGTNEYAYQVTAANRFGESGPVAISGVVSISAAQKDGNDFIRLTITNPTPLGAHPPEYFKIYRTKSVTSLGGVPTDLSKYSLIAQVPSNSQTAGGTTTFDDVNLTLPFTSTAYLGELTPQVLTFRQLLPMLKMDLAVLGPAYRWMILLYGTPILFAPKKWLRYINIGKIST